MNQSPELVDPLKPELNLTNANVEEKVREVSL